MVQINYEQNKKFYKRDKELINQMRTKQENILKHSGLYLITKSEESLPQKWFARINYVLPKTKIVKSTLWCLSSICTVEKVFSYNVI